MQAKVDHISNPVLQLAPIDNAKRGNADFVNYMDILTSHDNTVRDAEQFWIYIGSCPPLSEREPTVAQATCIER